MSDRLKELHHQRSLVQEQLAWLEREIAAVQGGVVSDNAAPLTNSPPRPMQTVTHSSGDATAVELAAEEIIAQYKEEGQSLHRSVKRGCLLYFFIALALLGIGVLVLYLSRTKT